MHIGTADLRLGHANILPRACSCRPQTHRKLQAVRTSAQPQQSPPNSEGPPCRRQLILAAACAAALLPRQPALAQDSLQSYEDPEDGFSISVPAGWSKARGDAAGKRNKFAVQSTRRALSWFPEGDPLLSTNVTVVITGVGPDYTSLGSFGSAEQFGDNLVASMDQSYKLKAPAFGARPAGSVQEAKLVAAKETNKMYFVEYTFKKPSEQQRHLLSLIALGYNGRVNRLYTLTAQCYESEYRQIKDQFAGIFKTFKPPGRRV